MKNIQLAFDVGHSSIGWAAFALPSEPTKSTIELTGCGVVTFRSDDCLASTRRDYRRQRRHIRSTRQRISRLKTLLAHMGVLSVDQLNKPGCAWPWLLAARVLRNGEPLSWPELWDVLRWYAHNRGYDGNRLWSAVRPTTEVEKDDSEKEANARTLMDKYKTSTMAETFCAICGLDPLGERRSTHLAGDKRPKGQNAAFPRTAVKEEARRIVRAHFGNLPGVDAALEKALFEDWHAITGTALKLPRRYAGGLLFGQLVPRFDNRIIARCPKSGEKVPSRNCREFLNFRWAMQLANIKVGKCDDRDLRTLNADERVKLDHQMRERGYLAPGELKTAVRAITGCERSNLDLMLLHPDAKEGLVVDPVQKLVSSEEFQPIWALLPERLQKRLRGKWRHGKSFSVAQIREQLRPLASSEGLAAFDAELQRQVQSQNSKSISKRAGKVTTLDEFLKRRFPSHPLKTDGRAAYGRQLLKQAYEDVLAGKPHPKEEGGCLFITQQMRDAQANQPIAKQTNNHLVRHRLLILERLTADIIKEYAGGAGDRIARVVIEVNRDLRQMSGMSAKEKAQDLGLRIANHHAVSEKLEEALGGHQVTAGLIRKGRVAEDLSWTCPYTLQKYEPVNLLTHYVDKDHIIPRSQRPADGLDSLVITFSEINKWKGNRTAWQFVSEEQGKTVPGLPNLSIVSLSRYQEFVKRLETFRGHEDDQRRKKKRKELLLLPRYEEKEFVPRDLTQTSQLVRLGAQVLRKNLPHLSSGDVTSLPGSVTGTVRKAWRVLGCLAAANPQVLDETGEVKNKTEIRGVTHLHHALDACVLGFASYFIPNNGRVWELIVKRNPNDAEKRELKALGVFGFNAENRFEMRDLDAKLKEQISKRLAEKRVVQHIPSRMDGLRVEQNTWGVGQEKEPGVVLLHQRIRQPNASRNEKTTPEKKIKLLGLVPKSGVGKLATIKGALVIPDNYGVAILDHAEDKKTNFVIVPWHKVWVRVFKGLKDKNGNLLETSLMERNHGKMPRILRNGQIIRVAKGTYKSTGVWKITSIKNQKTGVKLNLAQPDTINTEEEVFDVEKGKKIRKVRPDCRHEANLGSIVGGGLEVLNVPLTGFCVPCPDPMKKA